MFHKAPAKAPAKTPSLSRIAPNNNNNHPAGAGGAARHSRAVLVLVPDLHSRGLATTRQRRTQMSHPGPDAPVGAKGTIVEELPAGSGVDLAVVVVVGVGVHEE
jgi:hypothetical protein